MKETLGSRIRHAWNAFFNRAPTNYQELGMSYTYRPDRPRFTRGNEKTIVTAVYNRIAMDVAALDFQHVLLDEKGRYKETLNSGLNNCLTLEANIDQTAKSFIQDIVMSMFDEGCVAIVPVDTDRDPNQTDGYNILTMRTGKILEWYPSKVKVRVYNDRTGQKEDLILNKSDVGIIENPLYAVVNEPNSTMQRLIRKLSILDAVDEQSGSGKLDLIIQLPYTIKSDARRQQADQRRKDIEMQLTGSKYGIAYTDATERITQMNRPVENNLMKQIEYLTSMLFGQLSMSQAVLDGTADEQTMLNYETRTVDIIAYAIVDELKRKFLTKTARSQNKTIMIFKQPFKNVTAEKFAEISDKYTRNEILSSNEVRHYMGMKPSDDPKADELRNANVRQPDDNGPVNQEAVDSSLVEQYVSEQN